MPSSEWIDEALSRELSLMLDRGEGQHLEFMGSYPENGHELYVVSANGPKWPVV